MTSSGPDTESRSKSRDEIFHSHSILSRIYHGSRQHLIDIRRRKTVLQKRKALEQEAAAAYLADSKSIFTPPSFSKGISVYSYICAPGYSIQFSVPGGDGSTVNTVEDNFAIKSLDIDTKNLSPLTGFTGRFGWKVLKDQEELARGYNDINAVTGNMEGGTMLSIQDCIPTTTNDVIITCLFYDAGHGVAGLPNHDQCTITVMPASSQTWMEALAPPGSAEAQHSFSRFVLPAPHDCGMNSMKNCDAVLHSTDSEHISHWLQQLPNLAPFKNFSPSGLVNILPDIIYALTITQTASIETMLMMGARYFEFRPAKLYPPFKSTSGLRNTYYYMHYNLPGIAFDSFLASVVEYLDKNCNEIAVIHIRYDSVAAQCHRPSNEEITTFLQTACAKATNPLNFTDQTGLSQPIDTLRQLNNRIILLNNALQYSSYSDPVYATLVPSPIIAAFENMTTAQQEASILTLLQCQATATNINEVVAYSVVSSDASNSPLAATKAIVGTETVKWCRDNVLQKLTAEKPVVIMDDFMDAALVDTAIELSRMRLATST